MLNPGIRRGFALAWAIVLGSMISCSDSTSPEAYYPDSLLLADDGTPIVFIEGISGGTRVTIPVRRLICFEHGYLDVQRAGAGSYVLTPYGRDPHHGTVDCTGLDEEPGVHVVDLPIPLESLVSLTVRAGPGLHPYEIPLT